jgi:hypothetical protein
MRRVAAAAAFAALLGFSAGGVHADELDGWCAQVKTVPSMVICSDPTLRWAAAFRNHLFEAVRQNLGPNVYKALLADQRQWIKEYTARRNVSDRATSSSLKDAIACFQRETAERNLVLAGRFPGQIALVLSRDPDWPKLVQREPQQRHAAPSSERRDKAIDALTAWLRCLDQAVDALAGQPESARTVVDAALGSCGNEESAFDDLARKASDNASEGKKSLQIDTEKRLLARVMAIRAARAKLKEEAPEKGGPRPAIDYNRM